MIRLKIEVSTSIKTCYSVSSVHFDGQSLLFFCHAPEKLGVRVPPPPPPPESYAYAATVGVPSTVQIVGVCTCLPGPVCKQSILKLLVTICRFAPGEVKGCSGASKTVVLTYCTALATNDEEQCVQLHRYRQ